MEAWFKASEMIRIFFSEQRFEQTAVGIETCSVQDRIFGFEIVGDSGFQLFVQILCPTDETYG
mgnify:CR=1 FL=1